VRPSPRAERLPRQRHIARLDARAPPRASRLRRIAPRDEKTSRVTFPVEARARGSTRTPRYAARADRASPHPPDRTVSPTRGAFRICARVAEDDATSD
jgi:hypothetical protein